MVDTAHRLTKNSNKPADLQGIIIKFCQRRYMEEMRRKSLVKKLFSTSELGFENESKIYVNLSLTKEFRQLWWEVWSFKSHQNYKYAWITSTGKMFLRKEQGHAAILVNNISDIDQLE